MGHIASKCPKKEGNSNRATMATSNAQATQPTRETLISEEEPRPRVRFGWTSLNKAILKEKLILQEHVEKGNREHVCYNYNQVHEIMKKWILLDNQ